MTLGRFLLGVPLSILAVGFVAVASVVIRRRLVPDWSGADAVLVDIVLTLSTLTVLGELLGTFGVLRMRSLVIVCVALGGAVWWAGSRSTAVSSAHPSTGLVAHGADDSPAIAVHNNDPEASDDDGRTASEPPSDRAAGSPLAGFSRWSLVAAAAAATIAVGSWLSRTLTAIDQGITAVDSHWYHLPFAIHFFQTGRTSSINFTDDITAYFPATSSLFHSMGMMFFRTDLLSTVLNVAWLALAILAAWCIGRPFGVAPVAALGPLILFGGPGMVETQAGSALTDVVGCALFLSAVAIALVPRTERTLGPDVLAALAAGLSTGAKFTFLPAAGALCIGLIVLSPRGQRLKRTAGVMGGVALTGAYWYVRNLVIIGNPLPSLEVSVGPIRLPHVTGPIPGTTVLAFLGNDDQRSEFLVRGLRDALGPVWTVVLMLSIGGAILALWRPDPRLRMLGLVAMTSNVAYLLTPQFVMGGTFFATNFRYAAPGVVLGLILVPVALHRFRAVLLPTYAAVLVVTQLDPVSWPFGFGGQTFFESVDRSAAIRGGVAALVLAVAVAAVVWLGRRAPETPEVRPALVIGIPLVLLLGLTSVHGRYLEGRYRGPMPFPEMTEFARGLHDADIAVHGPYIYLRAPFAGLDLSNRAMYLHVEADGGQSRDPKTCEEWVELLEEGRYDYIFVVDRPNVPGRMQWTDSQPDARLVATDFLGEGEARAYRLDPTTHRSCRGGGQ